MRWSLLVVLLITLTSQVARAGDKSRADGGDLVSEGTRTVGIKLGYVDLQRALLEVGEGQTAKAKLKTEMDRKKAELDSEQAKLTDDKAVLDKQGAMMSEEVRTQKFTEWQKRLYEAMQKAQKVQFELQEKERTELKKIFEKMDPIIAAIAEREGLTMVFEKTDSGLVYAKPYLDLTNELVRTYNDKHPSKGVPATKTGQNQAKAPAVKDAPKDAPKQ